MPPPHYKFHYDEGVKGWKESERVTATARWSRARVAVKFLGMKKKTDTVLNIDVKKLVNANQAKKANLMSARTAEGPGDEPESLQRTLTEPSLIHKPFVETSCSVTDGVWNSPAPAYQMSNRMPATFSFNWREMAVCTGYDNQKRFDLLRCKSFAWERPKAERKALVESAAKYQTLYLQQLLKEKDREMRLITNQLLKANKENVTLLRELEGYRGKNYDELYKENLVLKEQIERACRENVMLAGQLRKGNNRVLKKFERTKTVI